MPTFFIKNFIIKRNEYLEFTKNGVDEARFIELSADTARAICKHLEKVENFTCEEALDLCQSIQEGPLQSIDKQAIVDSIHEKVYMDFEEDSADNDARPMGDTSNNQTQLFHHVGNYFTAAEWHMIASERVQIVASRTNNLGCEYLDEDSYRILGSLIHSTSPVRLKCCLHRV